MARCPNRSARAAALAAAGSLLLGGPGAAPAAAAVAELAEGSRAARGGSAAPASALSVVGMPAAPLPPAPSATGSAGVFDGSAGRSAAAPSAGAGASSPAAALADGAARKTALQAAARRPGEAVYAFFDERGTLLTVSDRPERAGPALELAPDGRGGLAPLRRADGRLSDFNERRAPLFAKSPLDGFSAAARAMAGTAPTSARGAAAAPAAAPARVRSAWDQLLAATTPAPKADYAPAPQAKLPAPVARAVLPPAAASLALSAADLDKLAEARDLAHPNDDAARLTELRGLLSRYQQDLAQRGGDAPATGEELSLREAADQALRDQLARFGAGGSPASETPADPAVVKQIEDRVAAVEALRGEATGEMAERDALRQLLAVSERSRGAALRDRRSGKEMLELHKNLSRLDSVMSIALSLNEINAAQKALTDMLSLLDAKIAKINASSQQNQQNLQQAQQNQQQLQQWKDQAAATIKSDKDTQATIVDDEGNAALATARIGAFQKDLSALIAQINARDGGGKGDALKEYQRRLDLLPQVVQWRQNGNPAKPDAFSVKGFQDDLTQIAGYLKQARDGLGQLASVPVEFAGAVILLVPGPSVSVSNPTKAQALQILSDRKAYWAAQKAVYQKSLDSINRMLDAGNAALVVDEFGDAAPESLPRYRSQQTDAAARAQAAVSQYASQIDAAASQINGVAGSNLPPLSGLSLAQLRDAIQTYGDKVRAVRLPDADSSDAAHLASMNLLSIAKLLPYAADSVVIWAKADAVVNAVDSALSTTLPVAKSRLTAVAAMFDAVLADADADVAWINAGGDGQALLDRKTSLLRDKIIPPLQGAQDLVENTLLPFQRASVAQAQPATGDLATLFTSQKTLMTTCVQLYGGDVPWALATFGGAKTDPAGSHAKIAAWRKMIQQNLSGYDDAQGHHEGVDEYVLEIKHRKDPAYGGTEVLYGETQPYSLPRKISQYTAERDQRAPQINQEAAQIDEIEGKIEALSKGKYSLKAYRLPTDVTADPAGVAKVQALVDAKTIPNLAAQLKQIGADAQAAGGSDISLGGSGSGPPVGVQPPIALSDLQQIALLALDAAKRLVPTTLQQPESAPCAYAVARFLYSDSVVAAAKDALANQVPAAELFLSHAQAALGAAVDGTKKDDAFVDSGGTSETPDALYARLTAMFAGLDAFLKEGIAFFNLKGQWDQSSYASIDKVGTYYSSLNDIYTGGGTANASELQAAQQMKAALQKTFDDLQAKRVKLTGWMAQLNDPTESALKRVNESISDLQDKTRAVLEENVKWHDLKDRLAAADDILKAKLSQVDAAQQDLSALLEDPGVRDAARGGLPVDLVNRVEALRLSHGAWAMGQAGAPGAVVVKKSQYAAFLDTVLHALSLQAAGSTQNLGAIKQDLLSNPQGLTALIPGSQLMDFGNDVDGFYLVYQTQFSVPNGLETGGSVTLGNVAQLWGSNVSVTGYQFASPPEDTNAPYGDKGVDVSVETLQGKNWVNYLDVDFHRFAFDIPPDGSAVASARQSRLMLFDDFAVMLFGDRLYIGMAGFGDFALDNPGQHASYYGGNLKTSLKLTEIMKLNAEQQVLFAKDPRTFFQNVNLDFTGYDPSLNQDYNIVAKGDNKNYARTQLGPSFDVGRLLGQQDTFTMDLFWSKTSGTDDINQQTLGVSILKGFTLRDGQGRPWAVINNRATAEAGQQYNTFTDKLSITLPAQGIVISGQGKLLGSAQAYYGEIAKKIGDNSTISVGYGSPYVGLNNRLSLMMNTSFTLGQLWQAVVDHSRQDLAGGEQLRQFNTRLDDFFKGDADAAAPTAQVQELKRVFEQDVARKLMTQDIGTLRREIDELRKAGAFMDNTRVRGMVGFVSSPVSNDEADRAVGGGFVAGSQTELTLTKTQKALIDAKAQTLFREGMRLQDRLMDLTKRWQAAVAEIAQAQWDLKLAAFMLQNAGSDALRGQARVQQAEAEARLHQAVLAYNLLSGRAPEDPVPFDDLSAADLQSLLANIKRTIALPERLTEILKSLDPEEMKKQLGDNPFNLIDWLPLIDKLTVGVGTQLQDLMANQVFTAGITVRLPVFDPSSKAADKSYAFESRAAIAEMAQAQADRNLQVQKELEQAKLAKIGAEAQRPGLAQAAQDLSMAIRAYRNGLMPASQLQSAFDSWRWYAGSVLDADTKSALAEAWAASDKQLAKPVEGDGETVHLRNLDDAFALVSARSKNLEEVALRQQAAAEMAQSNDHRIQKAFLDVTVGWGFTASGVGWLPSIGITGIPVTPMLSFVFKPEELRELQVRQGKGQTEYYKQLRAKLEAGLALEFYQNVAAYRTAQGAVSLFDNTLLPQLRAEVDARRAQGASPEDLTAAQRRVDDALSRREQAELARRQSLATMNYLLGRPGDAALDVQIDPQKALADLRAILAAKPPVGSEQALLASRVEVARAVETMVDKDLKTEQLALEPVSLVVRSLGRLIDALGSDHIGNPDLVAAARIQTLTEERAQEAFPKQVAARTARAWTQLSLARAELLRLKDKTDGDSLLRRQLLSGRELDLIGLLSSLGADPDKPPRDSGYDPLPGTFADLNARLAAAEQGLTAQGPDAPVDLMDQEALSHQAAGFLRYYYANQTLGHVPIDQSYAESWIEVRLKRTETDPQTLLKLAELRRRKADTLYALQMSGARAEGEVLASDFETEVQMLRWATRSTTTPGGPVKGSLDEFSRQLRQRLTERRDEIAALLNLPPSTTLEALMALVPAEPTGSEDLSALSRAFVDQIRARQLDEVKRTLFEDGLPAGLGSDEDLIHQLRADTIAERMSYKGFTPVAAFGVFRGRAISGAFLEAPDPREIQRGLENVLADALRKDLEASGALQRLTLSLHSLMARVEDGAREIERRRELVEASEADYRAQMGRARGAADLAEVEAARVRLVDAWLGFSRQMVRTKSDFIALVAELEALGQGRETGLTPLAAAPLAADLPKLRDDPRPALLNYWTDRLLDENFRARFEGQLAALSGTVPGFLRAAIEKDLDLYTLADRDGKAVRARDFTPAESLDLLTRNDREGKRQALAAELSRLLDAAGGLSDRSPLVQALLADLDAKAAADGAARRGYDDLARATREGGWNALAAPREVRAAKDRAEFLRGRLSDAREALQRAWLSQTGGPVSFILKDKLLDAYLLAQQAYDDAVIAAFQLPAVNADRALAWRLDALFDLQATVKRQLDLARSGRGLLALDALIMLEESRLSVARWQDRAPQDLDAAARSLQELRARREAWTRGSTDLTALYAVTPVGKDGQPQAAVERWVTAEELASQLSRGLIKKEGGRYFVDAPDGRRELVGGVDAAERRLSDARKQEAADDRALGAAARMGSYDAVLDAPLGERGGYSVDELFGPGGLQSQGRLFFFERPAPGEGGGRLHKALHPLLALRKSPMSYALFVYTGSLALARDRYPTLESLASSPEAGDFHEVTLSSRGATALAARALSQRAAELRAGWVDVKLNSYGFARDEQGRIAELYLTQDDLEAQRKAFLNAARDLKDAQAAVAAAEAKAASLKEALAAAQETTRAAGLEFQVVQARRRAALGDPAKLAQDREYQAAQKRFAPVAKAAMTAQDDWRAADAQAYNAREALKQAQLMLERSKTWSLYASKDVTLSVDRAGGVVEAAGTPLYGASPLDEKIPGGAAAFSITGELIAAALDPEGRLVRYYQDPKAVAADAPTWSLKTVELGDGGASQPAGSTTVAPRYRLAHYETAGADGKPVPVLLSRRYMIERADAAKKGLDRAASYGLLPWNWGDLILELPRGIVDAPVELLTGRDPKQQHYLGRVYMYKTEGGETERHGFFRKVAGVIDVLDLLPDPVSRFYDPSQFPDRVLVDSPVLPGQSVFQKSPTTVDGSHDVHWGVGGLARERRQSLEDLTAARERTLSRFSGGVETTLAETLRGRAGPYVGSELLASHGRKAVDDALKDPVVAGDPRSDGRGTVVSSEDPGNIEVDRVEKRVTVRAGADQFQEQADALKGYDAELARRIADRRAERAALESEAVDAGAAFDNSVRQRAAAHAVSVPAAMPAPGGATAPAGADADAPVPGGSAGSILPGGSASRPVPAGPRKPLIDEAWWSRFLAGLGLFALLGGAAYLALERKPEPVVVPVHPEAA